MAEMAAPRVAHQLASLRKFTETASREGLELLKGAAPPLQEGKADKATHKSKARLSRWMTLKKSY